MCRYNVALQYDFQRRFVVTMNALKVQVIFGPFHVRLFEMSHEFSSLFTGKVADMALHAIDC